ncbi:MAG TPA: glucose-6-phosphate isomerase family protein [Candidatus Sulfotelmatobacter sp.]|nr:glucose-6-phosphate isomerase family protein [Candidatus Sulfotelmatobacter sp.]
MPAEPSSKDRFNPGLSVEFDDSSMEFKYGNGIVGPRPEHRSLNAIRGSLRDPNCSGPDPVYSIVMDVARQEDFDELKRRMLLFGIVRYAAGRLGDEPVRSQGHVHAISPHSGWSAPELFEIWEGKALIYAQEKAGDDPGRCIAIEAEPRDKVLMPPGWSHFVANADPSSPLIFAAWCDRQYGFDYTQMRAHHGLAWFPLIDTAGKITWAANPTYSLSQLQRKNARDYPELGLSFSIPIYEYLHLGPDAIQWVSDPARLSEFWARLEP